MLEKLSVWPSVLPFLVLLMWLWNSCAKWENVPFVSGCSQWHSQHSHWMILVHTARGQEFLCLSVLISYLLVDICIVPSCKILAKQFRVLVFFPLGGQSFISR